MSGKGYGAGTVWEQQRGGRPTGRWLGQASLGVDESGRRVRVSVTAESEAAAWRELNRARREWSPSTRRRPAGESVAAFLGRWLDDVVRPTRRERTYWGYRQIVEQHLVPGLGGRELASLTRRDVQAWTAGQKCAPMTLRHRVDCLRGALGWAVRWGIVESNPATGLDLPPKRRRPVRAMTPDAARAVLAATAGEWFGPAVAVSLYTGLRQGELLGLRWEDVDLKAGTLAVHKSLSRLPGRVRGTVRYDLGEPKSERSRRTVPLPAEASDALRELKKRALTLPANPHHLVLPDAAGLPVDGPRLTKAFQAALAAHGLEAMRWHDLRHGTASLLLSAGVPIAVVSDLLGHSGIAITVDTYGHLSAEAKRQASDTLSRAVSGA